MAMLFRVILLLLVGLGLFTGCSPLEEDIRAEISTELNLDLRESAILQVVNTHGGFHGDKETYLVFQLEEEPKDLELIFDGERCWHELPLSANTKLAAFGGEERGSLLENTAEEIPLPPALKNGYYYFSDHHSESVDEADDKELFNRYSYNFVLAFYDAENLRVYYYRLDT